MIWFKEKIKQFYIVTIFIVLWQIGSYLNLWNKYIIPYPRDVLNVMFEMIRNGELIKNVSVSIIRVLIGFSISFMLAFPLGVFLGIKKSAHKHLKLILEFLRHVPPLSLIPMLILWFGIGEVSRILVITASAFLTCIVNAYSGMKQVPKVYVDAAETLGANQFTVFRTIALPSALPYIFAGLRVAMAASWTTFWH